MCKTRPPPSLRSDAPPPRHACKPPSNDCPDPPPTFILGKSCLGWRTSVLWVLKGHLFSCTLVSWHHRDIHTSLWWVEFVSRRGKWTSRILDVSTWWPDHKPTLSTPRAETLGGGILPKQPACRPTSLACPPSPPMAWSSLGLRAGLCELTQVKTKLAAGGRFSDPLLPPQP